MVNQFFLSDYVPIEVPVQPGIEDLGMVATSERANGFSSIFHSPYTLPSSVSSNPCICHSYENMGGVGGFFPFWNRSFLCVLSVSAFSSSSSFDLQLRTNNLQLRTPPAPCLFLTDVFYLFRTGQRSPSLAEVGPVGFVFTRHESPVTSH
jgi:hypothetical protein